MGENHKKIVFINVYRRQPTIINIVGTNLLDTPISLVEHQLNKIYIGRNLRSSYTKYF
jgi:hypothetical protein